MHGNLTESRGGVITEAAMVLAEVPERKAGQVMFVGWIAEGAEIRVVRSLDTNAPARPDQAVELFHCPDHVRQMFNDMDGSQLVKAAVAERIREAVQLADDVGGTRRIAVDPDRTWVFANPAADVKRSQEARRSEMPAQATIGPFDGLLKIVGTIRSGFEIECFASAKNL